MFLVVYRIAVSCYVEVQPCYCLYLETKHGLRRCLWCQFDKDRLWWLILCVNLEGVLDKINFKTMNSV